MELLKTILLGRIHITPHPKRCFIGLCSSSVAVLVTQFCPTVWDPTDCSPPGSSVRVILQARISEWVTVSFSRRSSQPRGQTHVSSISCTGKWILYHWATRESLFQPMEAYLPVSSFFFSYCSWDSHSKNTGVVCHSLLQWTMFCQNSLLWPVYLEWHCAAWFIASLSYTSPFTMKAVIHEGEMAMIRS